MADAQVFETVCEALEERTSMERLEARGTVRLALKDAGFRPAKITAQEMVAVLEQILPGELKSRAVEGGESVCADIAKELGSSAASQEQTPETIFERLGRS